MRRIKDHGEAHDMDIVRCAWDNYSRGKGKRCTIKDFEKDLDDHLQHILDDLITERWVPSAYTEKVIHEKKRRLLAKAPVYDHALETAAILPFERQMYDYVCWQSPAVRPGLGTHALFRFLRNDLYRSTQTECYYNVAMDAHHYFPRMDHQVEKDMIARKIKDGPLRRLLYAVIDSYPWGSPLGIKISQITGQLYLAPFDRLAMRCFLMADDPDKMAYWTQRYISDKILTAGADDYPILCRGPAYLASRFRTFVTEGLKHYYRFVDNIVILHEDKTFLHLVAEYAMMVLARDYHIVINEDWNVRPTWMGIRLCGYQFYHDHTFAGKDNKKNTARQVHKLFKKGLTEEQVRIRCASRLGYIKHADCINLLKALGMENSIGKIIKRNRIKAPFEGLRGEDKVKFLTICKMLNNINGGG